MPPSSSGAGRRWGDRKLVAAVRRVYLVGAGVIARHHAAAVAHLAEAARVTVTVTDPNAEALASFGEQIPGSRLVADLDEMLAEPALPTDVVVVAAPPVAHQRATMAALASGRHVLCEKPLAMTLAEATEMRAAARAADRLLGCCSDRFLGVATTEEARRLVASGALAPLYHATFVHRRQRRRTGIEHQPTSRWFLDRSLSGGGTLMDWSPYDLTTLNHVLDPVRVEVLAAWTANPETALDLAPGTVFDTEQHVGASLRYHRADGQVVDVAFERAACTHGGERAAVEIEGSRGAVEWDWLDWEGGGRLSLSHDQDGEAVTETARLGPGSPLHPHHRPLVFFAERIAGRPSPAVVDDRALFNFACLRAIYDCAASGRPQTVELGEVG